MSRIDRSNKGKCLSGSGRICHSSTKSPKIASLRVEKTFLLSLYVIWHQLASYLLEALQILVMVFLIFPTNCNVHISNDALQPGIFND